MKNLKKFLALLTALSMLLCLSACGSFERKMAKSAANMGQLESMHLDVDFALDMELAVMGQSMDVDAAIKAGIDMNTEPFAMKMDMDVEAMGIGQQAQIYIVDEAGERVAYTSDDGGKTWERGTVEVDVDVNGMSVKDSLALLSKWADSFEKAGEEKINGSAATKYSGLIDAASLVQLMDASGADDAMESSLGLELDGDDVAALKDVPVSIWIDNKSSMVVRMDMDVTELMQSLLSEAIDEVIDDVLADSGLAGLPLDIKLGAATASVSLSEFDEVGRIELPAGVK